MKPRDQRLGAYRIVARGLVGGKWYRRSIREHPIGNLARTAAQSENTAARGNLYTYDTD